MRRRRSLKSWLKLYKRNKSSHIEIFPKSKLESYLRSQCMDISQGVAMKSNRLANSSITSLSDTSISTNTFTLPLDHSTVPTLFKWPTFSQNTSNTSYLSKNNLDKKKLYYMSAIKSQYHLVFAQAWTCYGCSIKRPIKLE